MSVVCVAYQRRCDRCGKLHKTACETARRTMAVVKRDGWQRRMTENWRWIDLCPDCLDEMESEGL